MPTIRTAASGNGDLSAKRDFFWITRAEKRRVAVRTWDLDSFDHAMAINPFQYQSCYRHGIHGEHEKRNPIIHHAKELANTDQAHSHDHTAQHSECTEQIQSLALAFVHRNDARKVLARYADCI